MKRVAATLMGAALGIGVFSMPRNAHALGPLDLELGAKAGMGTNPFSGNGPNPLGFGLGARGGVSIFGLYGGVNVIYYFGGSHNEQFDGGSTSVSAHSLLYGIEAGYGIKLSILTLRAQVGIGNATITASGAAQGAGVSAGGSQSNSALYLEPGVVGMISLGMWFVGADVNALVLTKDQNGNSKTDTALTFHGQVGVTF
jgi:hypothetical protein